MTETALQPCGSVSPVPWRPIALLALLALAMVAGIALTAGTRPTVPAPFGRANERSRRVRGGGGHLHRRSRDRRLDAVTTGLRRGQPSAVVPRRQPDRVHAWCRSVPVVIVDADGGNPVTSRDWISETDEDGFEWAPDGSAVAVTGRVVAPNQVESTSRSNLVDASDGTVSSIGPAYLGAEFRLAPAGRPPAPVLWSGSGRSRPPALCPRHRSRRGAARRPGGWTGGSPIVRLDGRWHALCLPARWRGPVDASRPHRDRHRSLTSPSRTDISRMTAPGSRVAYATTTANRASRPSRGAVPAHRSLHAGTSRPAPAQDSSGRPDDRWVVTRPWWKSGTAALLDPNGTVVDQPAWLADGAESWQRVP